MAGEVATRGEIENIEPVSDTSDGAPSTDSARETSEDDGEGSGVSKARLEGEKVDMIMSGRFPKAAGRANESGSGRSSKVLGH